MTSWAFWVSPSFDMPREVTEYWGASRFFGVYPAREVLCCFIAMTAPANLPDPADDRVARIRLHFRRLGGLVPRILGDLSRPEDIWHDDFYDLRLPRWYSGRVVLIGDASAAFLPTAGVGASMAMESAAVLADELTRTDSRLLNQALRHFVARRRARVDHIQRISRTLAGYMLVDSPFLAVVRNALLRVYPERQIRKSWGDLVTGVI
jgi:2-polyprenyl-6-methoxyphenol hydroxylase-like FAD-dependent oxidoreductase